MNPQCLGYNSTLFEITRSDLIHDGKFLATWMVRHESCSLNWIYPVTITPQNCSIEQKLTSVQFIVFDNFFKVAFANACLLLWNEIISAIFKHCVKVGMLHFLEEVLLKLQKFRWCQQQCSWKATVCIPKTPSTLTQKINNVLQNLDFWQENSIQAARASTFLYSCCCSSSSAI